jgi:hypothetical protein
MQWCTCTVRLGGSRDHEVVGKIVTIPELLLLKSIHGDEAVVNIVPCDAPEQFDPEGAPIPYVASEERTRLELLYGPETVKDIFPDRFATLPTSLKQAGLDPASQAKTLREKAQQMLADAERLDATGDEAEASIFGEDEELAAPVAKPVGRPPKSNANRKAA